MISEYVPIAHPDRMADLLAVKSIDDVQSFDKGPAVIEVLWTFNTVVVSEGDVEGLVKKFKDTVIELAKKLEEKTN